MSVLTRIGTALPKYQYAQMDLAEYMLDYSAELQIKQELVRKMYSRSGIDRRYSVLPDFNKDHAPTLFKNNGRSIEFTCVSERLSVYNREAAMLAAEAVKNCLGKDYEISKITHLITVSCTGMTAPGLDVELVKMFGLNSNLNRTSVNFMGCYASMHALKQADYICTSNPNARVLIVSVELCTLHFQNEANMDAVAANLLFGDGAAAAIVHGDEVVEKQINTGFRFKRFHSQLIFEGKEDMAWEITNKGFLMTLSSYVPGLIESTIEEFLQQAIHVFGIERSAITNWAFHPGGRKILEALQRALNIDEGGLDSSYQVLQKFGNMSSASILFVLKELFNSPQENGELTFVAAFGPGITMESSLFEYVN